MTLKSDIYSLVQPILGGEVIWMDQSKPRPALPYFALKVMSRRQVNRDYHSDADDLGFISVKGDREFTLNVQRYEKVGPNDPTEALQVLVDSIRLPSIVGKFGAKGLVAFDSDAVADISMVMDQNQTEGRATVDIMMRYKSNLSDEVGFIDTTIVTGQDNSIDSDTYTITSSNVTG